MRKLTYFIIAAMIAVVMGACSSSNTPTAVAEKAMECMQDNDYEGYLDLVIMPGDEGKSADQMKQDRKAFAETVKSKMPEGFEGDHGGVKSFEVTNEEISEDGTKATVTMHYVLGDGKEKTEEIKLAKNDDGDWKILFSK